MSLPQIKREVVDAVEPYPVEDAYPLSPMQQGMLFHSLYARDGGVNIEQAVYALHERLNVSAFTASWQQVVARHAILRSSFRWEGLDTPIQEVHSRPSLEWQIEDWRGISGDEQSQRLEAYLRRDRRRGFDFSEQSLNRFGLFRVGESAFKFVWTFHHAIIDGRSLVIIFKEVFAYYAAYCENRPLDLPRPGSYRDYIDWLGQQDLAGAEGFWRQALGGFDEPTPLVIERRPNAGPDPEPLEQQVLLSAGVTARLRSLADRNGLTLNTFVQGAWALLLGRYSGAREVVFGATRRCRRSLEDSDSIVGLFINTLPMRVSIPGELHLIPWLKEIRAQHLRLRDYEHTPLMKIQEWSEVPKGRALFDSILIFENYELNSYLQSLGDDWQTREFEIREHPTYPLELSAWAGRELLLRMAYDKQRFDDGAIMRMLGHLRRLLEAMAENPDQAVSSLPLLTDPERRQLLTEWNDTRAAYPDSSSIHRLFESQVERTPGAAALVFEGEQLSYRQLNEKANKLAHYLRTLGVVPDTLVGICLERSPDAIVGLLAILKAGGAYVPLDPAYPKDRLAAMLDDARPAVIITEKGAVEKLPAGGPRLVSIDTELADIERQPGDNPGVRTRAENLAYVIYTSGSTGRPKGVMIEHRSLVNYSEFAATEYSIQAGDRVLQFASLSFDASAEEIYPCLTRGATLVLRTDGCTASISTFLEKCDEWAVTVVDLPTAYWHEMVDRVAAESLTLPRSLRLVIIGGESALPEKLEMWRAQAGGRVRLVNTYGPTEAAIVSTMCDLTGGEAPGSVPVGRPVRNAQTYILDRQLQPVPVGVIGELHIGGAGLARGYLNRPELTKEKFILNPFEADAVSRLYKTGDLARYLPNGSIEYCGRADNQVKVHGFRIELEEIESTAAAAPFVTSVVALAREDVAGDKRLVAYVVAAPDYSSLDHATIAARLKEFLGTRLPHYMVPSAFVVLDRLPLSRNGKVDRKSLPAPDLRREEMAGAYVKPADPLQYQLVQIWEELFEMRPIGITDSFFDLGGHSLLSVRMMDRIEQTLGKKLPLATLFEGATIEHLASALVKQDDGRQGSPLVAIQPRGKKRPFFYLHGDFNGGGLYCTSLARRLGEDQPFYTLQPHGLNDTQVPATIEEMAESHVKTLRVFQPEGPYLLGGHCNGGLIAFEMARQLERQGQRVDLLALVCAPNANSRYLALHKLVSSYYRLRGLGPGERQERFLSWRGRVERVAEIRRYYGARLTELSQAGLKDRFRLLGNKAPTTLKALLRAFSKGHTGNGDQGSAGGGAGIRLNEDRRKKVMDAYVRAMTGYVPRRYKGRITLLWPAESPFGDSKDPTWGWGDVAGEVEVRVVPGGHLTCITKHVNDLAEHLGTAIGKAV